MSRVQTLRVGADEPDQRLDRWFRRHFPQVGQGRIEKLCRKGEIRVDGGRVQASSRIVPGQQVRIPPLPDTPAPIRAAAEKISREDADMIRAAVLYRDDQMIVLNKPAGLPSQGGIGQRRHVDGLADALRFGLDEKPRLVHRLDKDTSGVLLLARTARAATALTSAFRNRKTRKIYWAAVAGVPQPGMGTIRFGLLKAPGHGGRGAGEKMLCIHPDKIAGTPGAKRATTDYAVLSALGRRTAWLALAPITGRTHQLRAHMAGIGHPIIGDGKYGGSGQENPGEGWGAQLGGEISRKMHLHARTLRISHPQSGAEMFFTAPLSPHMAKTWATFDWNISEAAEDPFDEARP
ncbi:MAG: RluA family pseudouridine synthase [Paracoccaceae bacterium]